MKVTKNNNKVNDICHFVSILPQCSIPLQNGMKHSHPTITVVVEVTTIMSACNKRVNFN